MWLDLFIEIFYTAQLFNNEFRVIDAVDGSEDMLAKLNAKGVYRRTTQVYSLFRS